MTGYHDWNLRNFRSWIRCATPTDTPELHTVLESSLDHESLKG
jgi:hypothetical protein